jgi:hypothetical protein
MFPAIYRLIELALLLSLMVAIVERALSVTKIMEAKLHNKMSHVDL